MRGTDFISSRHAAIISQYHFLCLRRRRGDICREAGRRAFLEISQALPWRHAASRAQARMSFAAADNIAADGQALRCRLFSASRVNVLPP